MGGERERERGRRDIEYIVAYVSQLNIFVYLMFLFLTHPPLL